MANSQSDDSAHPEQDQAPKFAFAPDYIKVAKAYEQRLAEAGGQADDDAILETLRLTLLYYEQEIRSYPRDRLPWLAFPGRLALACRLAGGFKPGDRGELGELMAQLIEDFAACEEAVDQRLKNVARGVLPDGLEGAVLNVNTRSRILWDTLLNSPTERSATAEARRHNAAVDYLAEQLHGHVKELRMVVWGFDDYEDDEDGDGGEDLAA